MRTEHARKGIFYHHLYSDGTLFPRHLVTIHSWDVAGLDLTGTVIIDGSTERIIADGPDRTGMVMFEDGSEAYLHCPFFEGQDTSEGRMQVMQLDRAAREEAGLIKPVDDRGNVIRS